MSESMAKIRQISLYFRKILMYHGSRSMDHGTVEPPWNFFFALEPAIYKRYLNQKIKSSTVPSLFFRSKRKMNLVYRVLYSIVGHA